MAGRTTAAGYGWQHQKRRAQVKAAMERDGGAQCWRCDKWISPYEDWDLGHDDADRTIIRGPEHRACNRATIVHRGHPRKPEVPAAQHKLTPALRMLNFNDDGCIYIGGNGCSGYAEEQYGEGNSATYDYEEALHLTFLDSGLNRLKVMPGPRPR